MGVGHGGVGDGGEVAEHWDWVQGVLWLVVGREICWVKGGCCTGEG